jgi:hypothetical protein
VKLGRLELRENRTLEGLLAAYRIGARVAWRRLVAYGQEAGLAPATLYQLGDAIFTYIDELSAAAEEGYADEQQTLTREAEHRRRSLVRLLVRLPSPDPATIEEAARGARWALPDSVAAVAFANGEPERVSGRLGSDVVGGPVGDLGCALVPDPDAPGRLAQISKGLEGTVAALGPTVHWLEAGRSFDRARLALELALEGVIGNGRVIVADDHLATLLLHRDRALTADLARRRLAPLEDVEPRFRARLEETLRSWLDHQGHVPQVAEALHVHPQTVRYRLARLRALFGEALDDPMARFQLQLALHSVVR